MSRQDTGERCAFEVLADPSLEPDGTSTILRFTSTLDLAEEFRSRTPPAGTRTSKRSP